MKGNFWKTIAIIALGSLLVVLSVLLKPKVYDYFLPQENVLSTARTALLKIERESALVTTRAYIQAVIRKRDEQWYGTAEVIRIVPANISYAVNLAEIDRNRMEYDEQSRVLRIPLPDVKVHSIDPDLAKSETIRNLGLLRSESMTGNLLEEETEKMVRPTLEEMAKSPDIIRTAKEQAITSVKQFLEPAFRAAKMTIDVQPYFKDGDHLEPKRAEKQDSKR